MQILSNTCQICDCQFSSHDLIMVLGKRVCNSCLNTMSEIKTKKDKIDFKGTNNANSSSSISLYPKELKAKLDEYIIGQEHAKKVLSVAVYNHYKRISIKDPDIQKSNILLIGPTGCGKTHLIKILAKILNIPIAVTAATSLTEEGYIGDSVNSVIEKLYLASGKDIGKTETGMIFIDEIDKLARPNSSRQLDVGGPGVQQALLTLLEGSKITIGDKYGLFKDSVEIDTTNILFICGGAFPQLENIVQERLNDIATMTSSENLINSSFKISTIDLQKFGMIPEFLGRLPIITKFEMMDHSTLKKILTFPKDSIISQYQKLFKFDNIKLSFEEKALDIIAEKALSMGTGARSLRSILEDLLLDLMYMAPSDSTCLEIIINQACAEGTGFPIYKTI